MLRVDVRVQSRRAAVPLSACGRLVVTNAHAHLIGRWGVTVWLAKARVSIRIPCKMSKPLACLRGRLIARERAVGCSLSYYIPTSTVGCAGTTFIRCRWLMIQMLHMVASAGSSDIFLSSTTKLVTSWSQVMNLPDTGSWVIFEVPYRIIRSTCASLLSIRHRLHALQHTCRTYFNPLITIRCNLAHACEPTVRESRIENFTWRIQSFEIQFAFILDQRGNLIHFRRILKHIYIYIMKYNEI